MAPVKHPRTDRGEREFDSSSLRASGHGTTVHRDYAAHWFRWQYALRFVKKGMSVLDVGCGRDQMMVRILGQNLSHVPSVYVGVDVDKLPKKTGVQWAKIIDEFDITRRWKEISSITAKRFDVITCFEVIEHMPKERGTALLKAIYQLLDEDGIVLLSTPVYNGKHMAANHIHEYEFDELKASIEKVGFKIERVVGTFMTSQAAKRVATAEQKKLLLELHDKWFAWEVLSNFLAPLYPRESSNCCWILRR